MVFSPFRSAISHAPRSRTRRRTIHVEAPGRRGRPHSDGKMMQVRGLIETTTYSYLEIAKRTGVPSTNISRWATKPNGCARCSRRARPTPCRAGARAEAAPAHARARLHPLAERRVRELEAQPGVDLAKLREALELLKLTPLADAAAQSAAPPGAAPSSGARAAARARVIADLRAMRRRHRPRALRGARRFHRELRAGPRPDKDPALKRARAVFEAQARACEDAGEGVMH